jgi:ABC-type sugar transport system substrate-binding protein
VFALIDNQSVPFQTTLANGAKAAAAAAGVSITVADGASQTAQDIQLLENAIQQKFDGILLGESVPSTLAPALRQAKAANIPVVSLLYGDPGAVLTPQNRTLSVVADSTYCYTCSGALAADEAISKTGGNVNAVVITSVGAVLSTDIQNGFEGEIAKYCPKTCTVKVDEVSLSDIAQAVTTAAQVGAQDSKVNTMFPGVDFMVSYITPVLKTAHADGRISVISTNADLAPMQNMDQGGAVKGDVGNPVAWDSWGAMDQILRVLKGLPPSANENLPIRLFAPSNIKSISLNQSVSTWFGPTDYVTQYKTLWGVS